MLARSPDALGHKDSAANVPEFAALKTGEAMVVDGVLDEPFWKECTVATGLIDQRTGQPAVEQTLIRIAYTTNYLYVAVECLDTNTAALRATERREDRSFVADDWIEVHVDPPHNHRGKYAFFTNPLGTRADANEGPSGVFNYGWSADWDCAAKILADRWTFEMRIPFTVFNYFRRDDQRWGFNITRLQRRTDVTSFWSFNATDFYKPRHFGHLTDLDLGDSVFDRNWEVTPYASVQTDFNGDVDTRFRAGVDAKFRVTPSIISSWTVTPDFGQIEADDDTIELRDTERFLPEKRLFFNEGEELMRAPHRVYYSRRFTDLDFGAKASGQGSGYNFNFQNIYGDVANDGQFHGNSTVLRVNQDVGERSSLGYYAAGSALDEGHSIAASADGYFFLTDAWRARFQTALTDEELLVDGAGTSRDGAGQLGSASLIYDLYPWTVQANYNAISREFFPLLGYIPRRDVFGPSLWADYHPRSGSSWYKEYNVGYETQYLMDGSGDESIRDHDIYGRVLLRNDLALRASYDNQYHRPFDNWRVGGGVDVWASDYFRAINISYGHGEFEKTLYDEVVVGKRFKFWERLPIRWDFNVRLEDRQDDDPEVVWLNRLVVDLYITDDMWVKTSLQLRDTGVHNYSVIYGWRFRYNTYWYVVFNHVQDESEEEEGSVMTKVTYTFQKKRRG
ncbi:MAG: carbohydrate binding family 9 domain-containing protein [Verrucomicrobiales bacterium]|nr:carbohydrate binding family 9 domain-containing protein [Verrucomicrobiales bacterium]